MRTRADWHRGGMEALDHHIRRYGLFLRRRDLLAHGYSDVDIRASLERGIIFRVRQGWYSVPDAPPAAVRAVRVGGRLTGVSALESFGLRVPRRDRVHIAVPAGACRLRKLEDRRRRLEAGDPVRIHWVDRKTPQSSIWRVSTDDALLVILMEENRDIAVACCSAVMHHKGWPGRRLDAVFARAPRHVQPWRELVCGLDESHGETFVRLWLWDAGIPWESQPRVAGVGRLDGRVGPHTYIEVDGGQHDPGWTGDGQSTYENDHVRDMTMRILGDTVLRYTYLQLYAKWPQVLAAIKRAIADDYALSEYRLRHPYHPVVFRKGRNPVPKRLRTVPAGPVVRVSPSFSGGTASGIRTGGHVDEIGDAPKVQA